MKITRPSYLIRPPFIEKAPEGHYVKYYPTDIGTFSAKQLGKLVDLLPQIIVARVVRHGWDDMDIFLPKKEYNFKKRNKPRIVKSADIEVDTELKELCLSLSTKSRAHNLRKIKGPGLFEHTYKQSVEIKEVKKYKRRVKNAVESYREKYW